MSLRREGELDRFDEQALLGAEVVDHERGAASAAIERIVARSKPSSANCRVAARRIVSGVCVRPGLRPRLTAMRLVYFNA